MADRIRVRCRACRLDFYLSELARSPDGRCPRCSRPVAAAWTGMLRQEAARACRAHGELVDSVRRLVALPGNLELIPHSLVRDLIEEVDWEEEIAEDRELIRREVDELERMARTFARMAPGHDEGREFRTGLRRLATLLAGHGDRLEARHRRAQETLADQEVLPAAPPDAGRVHAAAMEVDAVAAQLEQGGEADASRALEAARESTEPHMSDDLPAGVQSGATTGRSAARS